MREIKFRAWNKLENYYHNNAQNTYDYGCDGDNDVMEYRFADLINYDSYILEQYTGLKDKNGVEIYEGDKVKYEETGLVEYEVKFDKGVYVFDDGWQGQVFHSQPSMTNGLLYKIEVIGNIHDKKIEEE
jgi:uncharacterized phage protein (TIGR01671 family)